MLPVANPLDGSYNGGQDAFVAKIGTLSPAVNTENSYALPNKGTLRILQVFAEVDYTACPGDDPGIWNANWLPHTIPNNANLLYDHTLAGGGTPTAKVTSYSCYLNPRKYGI